MRSIGTYKIFHKDCPNHTVYCFPLLSEILLIDVSQQVQLFIRSNQMANEVWSNHSECTIISEAETLENVHYDVHPEKTSSRKNAYIILTPLKPHFI